MKEFIKKFPIPMMALLVTFIFLVMMAFVFDSAMATVRSWGAVNEWDIIWQIHYNINGMLTTAILVIIIVVLLIPIKRFKTDDRFYKFISGVPIEVVAGASFFVWVWIVGGRVNSLSGLIQQTRALFHSRLPHIQNIRVISFLVLVFIAACLLGYAVLYFKDIYLQKSWKQHSLLWRLFDGRVNFDFKSKQNLMIALIILGLPVIGFFVLWIGYYITRHLEFGMFLFVVYVVAIFLYACNQVEKVRKDYLRLLEISEQLAAGNFAIGANEKLGFFESVKTELSTVQHGFSRAVERALSSERMKGELITNVSHDLKTPLTSIITYIDLLQKEDISDEKRDEYIKTLELKTDRLKTLIEDLFEVSKASSGNLQLDLSEVDVETLMKQTILGLEDRINGAGIQLRETYPTESAKLQLDGARMHRVFENLIINMSKYALPGTRAYIDVLSSPESVQIIFRNISAQEITHDVLELSGRFVRGEESRTTDGSGLGLAIAKSFTELQGGCFQIAIDADLFKVILTFNK